jgi:hypothetical protein
MNTTDLSDRQMGVIARTSPELAFSIRPDWMSEYWLRWMVNTHPEWMIANRPRRICYSRPEWVVIHYPEIVTKYNPRWMSSHHPEIMEDWDTLAEYRPAWMVENRPEWMVINYPEWTAKNYPNVMAKYCKSWAIRGKKLPASVIKILKTMSIGGYNND